ncbi:MULTISPECIES: hypothetical protein [Flavobacteriaceae]|uniref:hypothetical protein n=1 Tax=Flavobacteriaceae TaxID=49546 RepID=UPI001490DF8B|nr:MULTISPECIES: hypothetical protein [Allomuricauda]MDC6367130.1 hypothetical protein [Muricauda sp. AC10]
MLSNANNSLELLEVAQKEQLYKKLILQLNKDFELANVGLKFSLGIAPSELKKILQEKLYVLLVERFDDYLNLLYVVDIPENQVKSIKPSDAMEIAAEACFLLLKREWTKVWFKNQYSSSS